MAIEIKGKLSISLFCCWAGFFMSHRRGKSLQACWDSCNFFPKSFFMWFLNTRWCRNADTGLDEQLTLFMFRLMITVQWSMSSNLPGFCCVKKKVKQQFNRLCELCRPMGKSMFGDFLTSLDSFYFREHFHRRYDAGYYVSHKNWSNFRCGTKRQRLLRQSLSLSLFLTLINLWTLRLEMINFFFSSPGETSLIMLEEHRVVNAPEKFVHERRILFVKRRQPRMFVTCLSQPQLIFKWEMILFMDFFLVVFIFSSHPPGDFTTLSETTADSLLRHTDFHICQCFSACTKVLHKRILCLYCYTIACMLRYE